jgi:hypothetical protein
MSARTGLMSLLEKWKAPISVLYTTRVGGPTGGVWAAWLTALRQGRGASALGQPGAPGDVECGGEIDGGVQLGGQPLDVQRVEQATECRFVHCV